MTVEAPNDRRRTVHLRSDSSLFCWNTRETLGETKQNHNGIASFHFSTRLYACLSCAERLLVLSASSRENGLLL